MDTADHSGHRSRLREQFLRGDQTTHTDEALLELLLTYAIPQRDVRPLALGLLARWGSLDGVLSASPDTMVEVDGVKVATAALIKLVDHIRNRQSDDESPPNPGVQQGTEEPTLATQATLFDVKPSTDETLGAEGRSVPGRRKVITKARTALFGKAVLKESIELLPSLPDTESLEEVRAFLRSAMHYSAEQTRSRYARYITRRMFPEGYADPAMRLFAAQYVGRQELRDVCFYRFCRAEPLMYRIFEDLLLPAIARGRLERGLLADYLVQTVPGAARNTFDSCAQGITDALIAGGIAQVEREQVSFAYRDILPDSFAFVLHSEFPEPGIYAIGDLEGNQAIRAMLWNPARILPTLYEMRNRGLVSKVSEIDNVRQFTTRYSLTEVVEALEAKTAGQQQL